MFPGCAPRAVEPAKSLSDAVLSCTCFLWTAVDSSMSFFVLLNWKILFVCFIILRSVFHLLTC